MCRDRALTRDCVRFDSTDAEGRPPSDLAPGRWFWQPRAGAVQGATWAIRIPTATIHDRAWGADFDFNGDGLADVGPSIQRETVLVWLSTPEGPAEMARVIATVPRVSAASDVGDLDADGYSDIVIVPDKTTRIARRLSIIRGTPGAPLPVLSLAIEPWIYGSGSPLRVGDLDDDGFDDLACRTSTWQYLFRGGADGLQGMVQLGGMVLTRSVEDVTGDGIPDYASWLSGVFSGFRIRPDTVPGSPLRLAVEPITDDRVFAGRVGDVNGDGIADVFRYSTPPEVEFGGPIRAEVVTLYPPRAPFMEHASFPMTGDFDGDGIDEVLARTSLGTVWYRRLLRPGAAPIWLHEGFGTAPWRGLYPVGDLDGDGTTDLFGSGSDGAVRWAALSDREGPTVRARGTTYTQLGILPPFRLHPTPDATPTVVGDLDGDGVSELSFPTDGPNDSGCLTILRGRTATHLSTWCGEPWLVGRGLAAGDVTGSGANDALLRIGSAYQLYGVGRSLSISSPRTGALLFPAGDINHDGIADLVAAGSDGGSVLFGVRGAVPREGGRFVSVPGGRSGGVSVSQAGDLDADGFGDLVYEGPAVVVYAGSESGVRAIPLLTDPAYVRATPVGDIDGDGVADLLVETATDARFFRGGREGLREVEGSRRLRPFRDVVAVGDVNGDRRADVCADGTLLFGSSTGPDYAHPLAWADHPAPCVSTNDPRGGGDWDADGVNDVVVSDGFRSVVPPRVRPPLVLRLP